MATYCHGRPSKREYDGRKIHALAMMSVYCEAASREFLKGQLMSILQHTLQAIASHVKEQDSPPVLERKRS